MNVCSNEEELKRFLQLAANGVIIITTKRAKKGEVKIDYEAGPAMFPEVKKSTTLKDGTMKWCGSLNRPGFYRLKVIAHVDGKDYEGLCTAGFSPEKIQPFAKEPKDFNAMETCSWLGADSG